MKPKVSIILPSIRPQNLIKFYSSVLSACQKHLFEIIIPSPYLIPDDLLKSGNVTFIHTYASPTISFMQGSSLAKGEFIYNVTDDGLLQNDVLDIVIKSFDSEYTLTDKDIINLVYIEDVLDVNTLELKKEPKRFPEHYWIAGAYSEYNKPAINPQWNLAPHFFMRREYFEYLGGLDCGFEYLNYNLHDLVFRAQENGSTVYQTPFTCFLCSHLPNTSGDHGPIDEAHNNVDVPRFNTIYSKEDAVSSRIRLDINDWKNRPSIWDKRFSNKSNLPLYPK